MKWYLWPWNQERAVLYVFTFEHWPASGGFNFFFLFLNNAWRIEIFSQYKHFCFYCVYVFKMAIWLILNKQVSKIWCWAILAINVCVMCLCVCPTLSRLSEFHVRQREIKLVVCWESRLDSCLESCTDLPLIPQQVSDLGEEAERESPIWLRDWDVAPF